MGNRPGIRQIGQPRPNRGRIRTALARAGDRERLRLGLGRFCCLVQFGRAPRAAGRAGDIAAPITRNVKLRPLGISTVRDRVCMTAAMLVLEPIFEAEPREAINFGLAVHVRGRAAPRIRETAGIGPERENTQSFR